MARQSSSGTAGAIVGMVIFVLLFLATLVLSIVFYNQLSDAREQMAREKTRLDNIATRQDATELTAFIQPESGTHVAQALKDMRYFRRTITGQENTDAAGTKLAVDALNLEGRNLVEAVRNLQGNLGETEAREAELKRQIEQRGEAMVNLEEQNNAAKESFQEGVQDLEQVLDSQAEAVSDYQKQSDEQISTLDVRLRETRSNLQTEIERLTIERDNLTTEVALGKQRLTELRRVVSPESEREPDGRIASLLKTDDVVYIDLGYDDKILPGMTFEVFSYRKGVEAREDGGLRGKAQIEVINVNPHSAAARVMEIEAGQLIEVDDLIANVIYDRNRTYNFFVFGDFDVEDRGRPSLADRRRIEAMVSQWGGSLTEELGYDTDFLVLGVPPSLPTGNPGDDPVQIEIQAELQERYNRYEQLIEQANELSIPILNQNRFLSLVGYYRR